MNKTLPKKLQVGDELRIIASSRSLAIISEENKKIADKRLEELGFKLSFGKHVEKIDDFASSSIELRVEDLHEAFSDKNIKAILTVIGGFNSNQLLRYIDWDLIKNNPKIFCGFSDITALNNAFFTKTSLVTYSGPCYSTFGQKLYFDYTLNYFQKCLMMDESFEIKPTESWSDDAWYKNQNDRKLIKNSGLIVINEGKTEGTILGANLSTFNLLQGTEYFPDLTDSVLFLEDDEESAPHDFDRDLQSLIHLPDFYKVKGIVIGRFQKASKMTNSLLAQVIKTKKELDNIPVIANVDFGHCDPKITFPIGGTCRLELTEAKQLLQILEH